MDAVPATPATEELAPTVPMTTVPNDAQTLLMNQVSPADAMVGNPVASTADEMVRQMSVGDMLHRTTADDIMREVLASRRVGAHPLPAYLLAHLETLAAIDQPTQSQVDEARIPLTNWFRQQREALPPVI